MRQKRTIGGLLGEVAGDHPRERHQVRDHRPHGDSVCPVAGRDNLARRADY